MKLEKLKDTQKIAKELFDIIEKENIIRSNISERQLSLEIYEIAKDRLGIKKYWHKKIVRTGVNTIFPYDEKPNDLMIKEDDIIWIDFGPIFENFEADFGRTYVLGNNNEKLNLKLTVEKAWYAARNHYFSKTSINGLELFNFLEGFAFDNGYIFGNNIAGHLIDEFSHYKIHKSTPENYICKENLIDLKSDLDGLTRFWILEVHFVTKNKQFGSFFEQLLI
ncbi:aminopeptidase P family protein [Leptospira bandrabouensis]|uniref:M24 family metallopeptidase n=1 Tax=Leptospira bandrabouensis TaxID=2484903 RepID=UPI00223D6441|nr:M24 family metallopeptidase [Leptospira bandrabouensis]MCW7479395.1 aminopeptidase P family protein [Leptospira bandrabouensis]MCW7487077.1 aminopeptidase P family protein [Leptospira bandrabouensis]